jgi:hypothetical protein
VATRRPTDDARLSGGRILRHRVLSHTRPWRLRVKGSGQRILSKRQRPRRGGQDAVDPLTLSAAGSSSGRQRRQPPQESYKALPRAGFEAHKQHAGYPTRRGYLVIVGIRGGCITGAGAAESIGSK